MNTKPIKKAGKKTVINAFAVISNKEIPTVGVNYQFCVHESEVMAHEQIKDMAFVIGRGYKPRIVPCTITYYL